MILTGTHRVLQLLGLDDNPETTNAAKQAFHLAASWIAEVVFMLTLAPSSDYADFQITADSPHSHNRIYLKVRAYFLLTATVRFSERLPEDWQAVDPVTPLTIDLLRGVFAFKFKPGFYHVDYTSGFMPNPDDEEIADLAKVPEFVQSAATLKASSYTNIWNETWGIKGFDNKELVSEAKQLITSQLAPRNVVTYPI